MWSGLVRGIALSVPPVLIGFWGYSYVRQCLDVLTAPGIAVAYTLDTPAGKVEFAADSYRYEGGRLKVYGLSAQGPRGRLGSAQTLDLDLDRLVLSQGRHIEARASNAKVTVRRLQNGKFEFSEFVPPSKEPPAQNPFRVAIDRMEAEFVDLAGAKPFRLAAITPKVVAEGAGEDWIASAKLAIRGLDSGREATLADFEAQSVAGRGVRIGGNSPKIVLARLFRHLKTTPDLRPVDGVGPLELEQLTYEGPFTVSVGSKGAVAALLSGKAKGVGFRYKEWSVQAATFQGTLSESAASGAFTVQDRGANLGLQGAALWTKGFRLFGNATGTLGDLQSLPPSLRQGIPRNLATREAKLRAWVDADQTGAYLIDGVASARAAGTADLLLVAPSARFQATPKRLVAAVSGNFRGLPLKGGIDATLDTKGVVGFVDRISLDVPLVRRLAPSARDALKGVEGRMEVSALVGGTFDRPVVRGVGSGTGSFTLRDRQVPIDRFEVQGSWKGKTFGVQRLYADTSAGRLALIAKIDPESGSLQGRALASVNNLAAVAPEARGLVSLSGDLSGSVGNPRLVGKLFAFGLGTADQQVPYAQADFSADRKSARLGNLRAAQATAALQGDATVRYADGRVWGRFSVPGLLLSNYVAEDVARGLVDLDSVTISGTLARPVVQASGKADRLVAQGVILRTATFQARYEYGLVTLSEATASFAGGTASLRGDYRPKDRVVHATLGIQDVALGQIGPVRDQALGLEAQLSGTTELSGPIDNLRVQSSGKADRVTVEGTDFGGGVWTVSGTAQRMEGEIQVGSLDRYLRLENLVLQPDKAAYSGTLVAYKNALGSYLEASRRNFRELPAPTQRLLEKLEAVIDADISFSYQNKSLDLDVPSLQIADLRVGEDVLGTFKTKLTSKERRWDLQEFGFVGPAAQARVSGYLEENGTLSLDGELNQIDLGLLSRVIPQAPALDGKADFSFLASQRTRNPKITASLFATQTLASKENLVVQLAPIEIVPEESTLADNWGKADIQGSVQYRNLEAKLVASLPVSWRTGIRKDRPVESTLALRSDLVKVDEAGQTGLLDPARTQGSAGGELRVFGIVDELKVEGDVVIENAALALRGFETGLQGLNAALRFRGGSVAASASGNGTRGGDFTAVANLKLPPADVLVSRMLRGETDDLLASGLSGSLTMRKMGIRQASDLFGSVRGILDGQVTLSGSVKRPVIGGDLTGESLSILLAPKEVAPGTSPVFPIDPVFDLRFATVGGADLATTAANLTLGGQGRLGGSLAAPQFRADLTVSKGTIKLPNARIRIEERGLVRAEYRATTAGAEPDIQVVVDLEGRTSITASRFGAQAERFDVNLGVKGDLMKEGALVLTASSDPPGLSQDRILAIIGTGDLIESLQGGFGQSSQFQEALLNVAIPVFLDGFTTKLAEGLGLDYISLSLGARQTATVSFAKTLLRGLVLEGRRQVGGERASNGEPIPYEFRLAYRLPSSRANLDRYRLVLGIDELRPWKIGIEYSTRFGNAGKGDPSKIRVLSGKRESGPDR